MTGTLRRLAHSATTAKLIDLSGLFSLGVLRNQQVLASVSK
jgi:hypothetical protein